MRITRLDHVALELDALDEGLAALTDGCAMRVVREGTRVRTGQRIVMVGDGTGMKLELIERAPDPAIAGEVTFLHLAFQVDDVDDAVAHLTAAGWTCEREVHALAAAQARTALFHRAGIEIQVIEYAATSPDIVRWSSA